MTLIGLVASVDGQRLIKDTISGPVGDAATMGVELGDRDKGQGAKEILDEINAANRS